MPWAVITSFVRRLIGASFSTVCGSPVVLDRVAPSAAITGDDEYEAGSDGKPILLRSVKFNENLYYILSKWVTIWRNIGQRKTPALGIQWSSIPSAKQILKLISHCGPETDICLFLQITIEHQITKNRTVADLIDSIHKSQHKETCKQARR